MMSSGEAEYDAELLVDFLPEGRGELGTTVRGDMFWQSIVFPDITDIGISHILACPIGPGRNITLGFGEPVCDNQYSIIAF